MGTDVADRTRVLAAVVESSCDAVVTQDLDGAILTWNAAATALFGYTESEAVGQPISIIVPTDRLDELRTMTGRVVEGECIPLQETVRRTRSGGLLEVAVTLSPVREPSGALIGVSTIARDSSEHRWMAQTLDEIITRLEDALTEAQESEGRCRRFLADAAHQLRTPMAGIRACAEAVLQGADPADRERLLERVVGEVSRANGLVTSLLKIARLEQRDGLALEQGDISDLCRWEVDRSRALAPHLEIRLRVDATDTVAVVDSGAVREMLANLLDNARRHARSSIDVVVSGYDRGLEIRVVDDGPGLVGEVKDRAFERFASLDGKGGSGLGLPIARGVALAHGGELSYQGREGGFVVRLPVPPRCDRTGAAEA